MKRVLFVCLLAVVVLQATAQQNEKAMKNMNGNLACKLTTPKLQERKRTVLAEVKKLVIARTELANGVAYSFNDSDSTIDLLGNFIKTERMCCPFFEFQLIVTPERPIELQLTGPEGTKEFIESELGF